MDSPRSIEEILGALDSLETPADPEAAAALLRELALGVAGQDPLTIAVHREAALRKLDGKIRGPAGFVDAALAAHQPVGDPRPLQGRGIDLTTPEPWLEPVDGIELLDALTAAVARHVVLLEHAIRAVALWVVHTHAFEAAWITPRLAILSPVKRCAKSLLLEILEHLVPKPINLCNVTAAAVFRSIEQFRPTLLIDEADTFLADKDELRGILNSGHRRNGSVVRTVGEDHEIRAFSTFAPVAIAKIGRLPDTLADRSIPIPMRRKRSDEHVEVFRPDRAGHLGVLARKTVRWALDHWDELSAADPKIPPQLHDREADSWRPLLAIADLAGGEWPRQAREAAVALSAGAMTATDEDRSTLLLGDLRSIFDAEETPTLFTDALLEKLHALDERPWAEWGRGKPLSAVQLAALLRPFGIKPRQLRVGEKSTKGYARQAFEDAFSRYLPPLDPKHPKQINADGTFRSSATRNKRRGVSGIEAAKSPVGTGIVSGVSGRQPSSRGNGAPAAPTEGSAPAETDEVAV